MKRTVDLIFSITLLCVLVPVLLAIAVLVRLSSPGPVLFRQWRVGRHFSEFELLKFRTMRWQAEGDSITVGSDARITRVGGWLRRHKLDELPQLWNVARGEMSMVGPRPVVPQVVAAFAASYARLLQVRPGLTDPASLKYCRESELLARHETPLEYFERVVTPDKLRISAEYLDWRTNLSDLALMAMTAMVCCFPRLREVVGPVEDEPVRAATSVVAAVSPDAGARGGSTGSTGSNLSAVPTQRRGEDWAGWTAAIHVQQALKRWNLSPDGNVAVKSKGKVAENGAS